jgi:hypothetical protein
MIYPGSCHCGAVAFAYETRLAPAQWPVRACQCGFCRAHGVLTTSDPAGSLGFHFPEPAHLQRYRFGLRTADFLLCRRCGVYVGAVIAGARGRYGIINVNALAPLPPGLAPPRPVCYDGESPADRAQRREQRWTPVSGGI